MLSSKSARGPKPRQYGAIQEPLSEPSLLLILIVATPQPRRCPDTNREFVSGLLVRS
jgi:hypothetical protein